MFTGNRPETNRAADELVLEAEHAEWEALRWDCFKPSNPKEKAPRMHHARGFRFDLRSLNLPGC